MSRGIVFDDLKRVHGSIYLPPPSSHPLVLIADSIIGRRAGGGGMHAFTNNANTKYIIFGLCANIICLIFALFKYNMFGLCVVQI